MYGRYLRLITWNVVHKKLSEAPKLQDLGVFLLHIYFQVAALVETPIGNLPQPLVVDA